MTPESRAVGFHGWVPEVVLECLEGVGPFLVDELAERPEVAVTASEPTEVRASVADPGGLVDLRCAVAVYEVVPFEIAGPVSLLKAPHLDDLLGALRRIRATAPKRFDAFRIGAAGVDSPELRRLRMALEEGLGIPNDQEDGALLVRLRRAPGGSGWQALVRTTPRPLSTRSWRTERYPGALNATIAAAVVRVTEPTDTDRFVDLLCGSGTLLIERLAAGPLAEAAGIDVSPDAVATANLHLRQARHKGVRVELVTADVRAWSDGSRRFDRLVANPPWGELVGSHAENDELYPALLAAADRAATPDAVFCLLTQDIRRLDAALRAQSAWRTEGTWRFFQKGHRPQLYRLVR